MLGCVMLYDDAGILNTILASINSAHTVWSAHAVHTNASNYRPNWPDEQSRIKSLESVIREDVKTLGVMGGSFFSFYLTATH